MRIAFVFPGQGSQSVGMLSGFAGNETVAGVMARADEALGFSLTGLIAEGPAETLSLTVNTQPAMLASSVAFYEAWLAAGGRTPEMMAGHSLGEYSALCAAGAMSLETAVRLVRFRAEAMQSAVPVGVGGMAVVYRARDTILGRDVALKVLKKEFAEDPDIRKRFSIESRAVAKLSHHNIVSVFDVGSEDGTDYIVMELIEGITLKQYLQRKGHLSWEETIFFAEQVARALMHAHSRGIIHQDVKPQNVIILRDGTAKLTDFGIASFAAAQETRVVQEAIGSVHYISPEQAKGSKIDYRTDIYSLGVVMYEMLTGRLPFEGETALQIVMQHINEVPIIPSAFVPGIPKGMDDIVMHAMSANISRRYESAEKMYEDMEVLRSDPNARFHYVASEDNSGETQIIGADIQRAARRSAAEHEVASVEGAAAPRTRTRTQTRTRTRTGFRRKEQDEPDGFFEKLAERPGMAVGMAVGVIAVISLLLVGIDRKSVV